MNKISPLSGIPISVAMKLKDACLNKDLNKEAMRKKKKDSCSLEEKL